MGKAVTMKDIAQALDLSTVSVSNALTGKTGVSPAVRGAVMRKAQEMGYVYTARKEGSAPSLQPLPAQLSMVGVLVADRFFGNGSYYTDVYAALSAKLSKCSMISVLEVLPPDAEEALRPPAFLQNNNVEAFIILGQLSGAYIASFCDTAMPYVCLDFYDTESTVDAIVCDSMYGSYLLTNYLIKQGHRDIGFVGNMKATSSIMDRYLGYHSAIVRNNLVTRAECIVMDRETNADSKMFDEFKLPDVLPQAFVCNCDDAALRLVRQLSHMGVKVPDDISVVGYDDHITASLCDPPLTTFKIDKNALVAAAVEALRDKIADHDLHMRRKIIGGEIVYRQSVKRRE